MIFTSRRKCLKTLKSYKSKPLSSPGSNYKSFKFVEGIPCATKKRCIHKSLDGLKFEREETRLNPYHGYRLVKNSGYSHACKVQKEKIKGQLDLFEWIDHIRNFWLTIADIKKMKHGEKLKVVLLDRNVSDRFNGEKGNKLMRPEKSSLEISTYTHDHDMQGELVIDYKPNPIVLNSFEFHVEYKKGEWYPLSNGVLPAKDSQFGSVLLGKKTSWKEMPATTHVGFRGPMVRYSDLNKMPMFYVYHEFV